MREDAANPSAKLALDAIDENTVQTEEDFNGLLQTINNFTMSAGEKSENGEITYNFTPPADISLEEFGIGDRSEPGKFFFYEHGVRVEKKAFGDEFETVGPVDESNKPIEGHPAYVAPDVHERRSMKMPSLPPTREVPKPRIIDLSRPEPVEWENEPGNMEALAAVEEAQRELDEMLTGHSFEDQEPAGLA